MHLNKLKSHLTSKSPSVGNTLFIAIDGHGGSGKTTLSNLLGKELGAQITRTDDFASWDNPTNWWPQVIEQVFKPISNGSSVLNYPRSKWWESHNPEPVVDQPVTPIMILEGVSSLRREFREFVGFGIFVDIPEDICLKRGVDRDLASGTDTKEKLEKLWREWIEEENEYFKKDRPEEYADIIFDGTNSFESQLGIAG